MMKKLENEVLLSRRAALGAFATVALGTAGLLAGCGSDKATVTEDAGDGDKKEEAKKEEQSTTDLAVGATVTTTAGLSVVVDSVQPGLTNYDGSTMTGIHVTYVNNGDEGADYNIYDWKGEDANGAQQNQGYYSEGSDELQSGTLAAGGSVAGNIYFDGDIKKALYFANMFDKSATEPPAARVPDCSSSEPSL